MALEDTLELDISSALQSIDTLAASMEQAATQFGVALAQAIDTLREPVPVEADVSSIGPDIEAAVEGAEVLVTPEADASGVTAEVDDALAAVDSVVPVEVEADTSAVAGDIEDAIAGADSTVSVEGDTGTLEADIEAAVEGVTAVVKVEADTGAAQESMDDLAGSATSASGAVGALSGGLGGLAAGHPAVAGAVAGVGAVVGIAGLFASKALDARESADTFRIAVGDMGDEVRDIDVGGLNQDLGDLAVTLGQDDEAALNAAARIFQLGEAAGGARPKVAETTKQVLALAASAVSTRPALGELGTVAEGLVGALARGGRPAANFGIALTAAEINARALADTGKITAAELTIFEKAAAGAAIATERLGDSIGEDVRARAETTATGFARLRQELDNVLEAAGEPLLDPLLQSLEDSQPALEESAAAMGELLAIVVPLVAELATELAPTLIAIAEAVGVVVENIDNLSGGGKELGGTAGQVEDDMSGLGNAINFVRDATDRLIGGIDETTETVGEGADAIEKSAEAFADAGEATGEWSREQAFAALAANIVKGGVVDYETALRELKAGMHDSAGAAKALAEEEERLAEAAVATVEALKAQRDAQDALLGVLVSVEQADIRYARSQEGVREATVKVLESQAAYNKAVGEFGAGSAEAIGANEDLTSSQLGLREAQLGSLEAARDLAAAVFDQAEALKVAGPEVDALRGQLIAMRDRFPELRGEIDKYIAKLDGLKAPDFRMDEGVSAATGALARLSATLGPITDAQAREVGRVFGRGLANGLNSEAERLRLAGALAGERITQGARQSFGMRSPSRIGIEIGKNFAEAVAAGIVDGADEAVDAAASLAADVVAKIENALFADFVAGGAFEGKRLAISLPGVVETQEAETLFSVLRRGNLTVKEWADLLDGTSLSMEQLLGIQKELNDEVQAFASGMVSAFDTVEDALAGLKPDTTLIDFIADANEKVRATLELERDLNTLRRRGADDLAAALATQGANAAQAIADAVLLDPAALRAQEREFERILAINERNAERAQNLARQLVATVDSPEITSAAVQAAAKLGERSAEGLAYGIASRGGIVREAVQSLFEVAVEGALEEAIDRMAHLG